MNPQSTESQSKCLQELSTLLPNIQSTLYTALFCKNKLSEPLDSLIFGFFIGFLSSRKDIKITDSCLTDLLEIYFTCTKSTKNFENLLQLLSSELTLYLYKNSFVQVNQPKNIEHFHPQMVFNPNLGNEEEEEVLYEKCMLCTTNFNIYDIANYGLGCGCIVHNKCFDNLVKSNVNLGKLPINCPMCKREVNNGDIVDSLMFNNPDLLAKYEKLTLEQFTKNAKDVKTCPTKGCGYIFSYSMADTEFSCPKCKRSYCLRCQADWHYNKTCVQYKEFLRQKNDSDFQAFAQEQNYKKCPFCLTWVEKVKENTGDQIHCRCGNDFCFKCGERYMYNHVCRPFYAFPYYNPYPGYYLTKKEKKALRKKQVLNRPMY